MHWINTILSYVFFFTLVYGPALLGVASIVVGIRMLRKSPNPYADTRGRRVFGICCLIAALGIGACYGGMWWR